MATRFKHLEIGAVFMLLSGHLPYTKISETEATQYISGTTVEIPEDAIVNISSKSPNAKIEISYTTEGINDDSTGAE